MSNRTWTESDLHELQDRLEREAVYGGMARHLERVRKATSSTRASEAGAAASSKRQAVFTYAEALEATIQEKQSQRGRPSLWVQWVEKAGVKETAAVVSKVILDRIYEGTPLTTMYARITEAVLDEVKFSRLEADHPGAVRWKQKEFARKASADYRYQRKSMGDLVSKHAVDTTDIDAVTDDQRQRIGGALLNLFMEAIQLPGGLPVLTVRQEKTGQRRRVKPPYVVRASEPMLEWLEKRDNLMAERWPMFGPMVVEPLPWAQGVAGGYRYRLRERVPVVKTRSKDGREMVAGAEMPLFYAALNRHQETPWAINRSVFEVMRTLVENGGGVAKVPSFRSIDPYSEVRQPEDIEENDESRASYRKALAVKHDEERVRASKAHRFVDSFWSQVDQLAGLGVPALYFVWNADFRGRIYPTADGLHPQGDDLCRGILCHAEGAPIGDGAEALAVAGANALEKFGGRKLTRESYADRAEFIERNTDRILATAAEPLGDLWWTEAESPWQFLAFCFEWSGYVRSGRSPEFVTRHVCPRDGSCNGIQHLSALGRDEQAGRLVNLLPTEIPKDIYGQIGESVRARLATLAAENELARKWVEGMASGMIDQRKLVKRPSMTISYGAKEYGFVDQIKEWMNEQDNSTEIKRLFTSDDPEWESDKGGTWLGNQAHAARVLLARVLWETLEDVVDRGMDLMRWMQDWARIVAKGEVAVAWEVPATGFPVLQEYWRAKDGLTCINTVLMGKRIQAAIFKGPTRPHIQKNVNSVAPNVIHSYDGAHLALTVARLPEGVPITTVHDSYGTLAPYVEALAVATREAFVELHSQPLIDSLEDDFRMAAGEQDEEPEAPAEGTLDLESVKGALYLFN